MKFIILMLLTFSVFAGDHHGMNGMDGMDGMDGTNGVDGVNGTNGSNGANGENGSNGSNGADSNSAAFSLIQYTYDPTIDNWQGQVGISTFSGDNAYSVGVGKKVVGGFLNLNVGTSNGDTGAGAAYGFVFK